MSNDDECIVHTHPVPPEELRRYSTVRDADAEQDIANYVHGQARDESVQHVERVKTEYVLGEAYEIWDVTTDKDRWWVITNLTNLYSQKHFPSLDYTLSFHIGLMMRIRSRSGPDTNDPDPFDEIYRRQEQARNQLYSAIEAEELQSVGMHLKECLLALIQAMKLRIDTSNLLDPPQTSNFKAWADILISILCVGSSNDELRRYLKRAADDAWQLANWLTHSKSASRMGASIVCDATEMIVGNFAQLVAQKSSGGIEDCPQCSSRNIRWHFDINIEPDGEYFSSCGACGWSNKNGGEGGI